MTGTFDFHFGDAIRASNPHPSPGSYDDLPEDVRERAERDLANIMGDAAEGHRGGVEKKRNPSRWLMAASTATLLVIGVIAVPNVRDQATPEATAEALLTQAGDAAEKRQGLNNAAVTSQDYQRRVDSAEDFTLNTVTEVGAGGLTKVNTDAELSDVPEALRERAQTLQTWRNNGSISAMTSTDAKITLKEVNSQTPTPANILDVLRKGWGENTARGALELLTLPGLDVGWQSQLFHLLADEPGAEVQRDGNGTEGIAPESDPNAKLVRVSLPEDGLSMAFYPVTGQLVQVDNLVGQGVRTLIDAAGILNCVHVTGLNGPESVSLACADDNYMLADLTWDNWGEPQATARGTAWMNACEGSCADDKPRPCPVEVKATEQKQCGYNLNVYTRLDMHYPERAKDPENTPQDEVFDLQCSAPAADEG